MTSVPGLQLQDIPLPAFALGNALDIILVNAALIQLSGYREKELLGMAVHRLLPDYPGRKASGKQDSGVKAPHGAPVPANGSDRDGSCLLAFQGKDGEPQEIEIRSHQADSLVFVFLCPPAAQGATVCGDNFLSRDGEQAYWEWQTDTEEIYYSSRFMALLGYENRAFTGPTSFWQKHMDKADVTVFDRHLAQASSGKRTRVNFSLKVTDRHGQEKWVNIQAKVQQNQHNRVCRLVGMMKDVSKSHFLLGQGKAQSRYLNQVEHLSVCGHWRFNPQDGKFFWSSGVFKVFGLQPSSYRPDIEETANFFLPSQRGVLKKNILAAMDKGKGFYFKACIKHPSGQKVKIEALGEVERDHRGRVAAIFGLFRDISRTEEVFEKLKLLAMVNYTIKVPIFFIDDNDNVVYQDLSPQGDNEKSTLFNYINFSITDYLALKKTTKSQGQIKRNHISFDKFNSVFDLCVTYEAEEGIYIWIVENVTDNFRKEQQQIISNRLALLGNTFGNVSHDINNVLGVALGAIEMLELKYAQGERDISGYIERVKNAIDKGKSVTERLLAFTRKPPVKVVEFDPVAEIRENRYLFKQLLPGSIELVFDFAPVHCLIHFPQGEFINILLNIVLNAQDAIKETGGKGRIELSVVLNREKQLEVHVKDSGIGIAPENISRIFDPFFSSKSVNKGNGIGLANVYSTMYKHNGQIQVEGSCELGGAHFTLIFNCQLEEDNPPQYPALLPGLNIRDKNVLILDDEVSISEFIALYLESEGAFTTYANNKEALLAHLASGQDYDIFITDMILPDLSGREAVNLVKAKFPEIKIYSISGYITHEDGKWQYPVLRKPFNSKELADFLMR
ncbi:PAS domain-containing protein [Thalassomonas viridans]|uniref:histidine kinase n=1 Tax=Thalassomonas viridans TaxID=137584 RepID=A0AAE9YXW4_9GAMM|nr:PAS domain-containing sensor histidine kinase [Thalassomonas viridans]WDE03025.1 PAS domain-containing protein [Thalassomonas viridans]